MQMRLKYLWENTHCSFYFETSINYLVKFCLPRHFHNKKIQVNSIHC